eukprot:gene9154-14197_t
MESEECDAKLLIEGISTVDAFWKISSLLSEAAIAGAGVDVVFSKDDVKPDSAAGLADDEEEDGCFVLITRRRFGTQLSWSRDEDNTLRALREAREKSNGELADDDRKRLDELEPKFEAFLAEGMRAIGNLSYDVHVGWLPYSLLMAVNPGLLSKKGRKTVEMKSTLPLCGMAQADDALPAGWKHAFLITAASVVGLRKYGTLLSTKGFRLYYTKQPGDQVPVVLSAKRNQFEIDAAGCVVQATEDSPVGIGNIVTMVDSRDPDAEELRSLAKSTQKAEESIEVQVLPSQRSALFLMGSIGAFFKCLEEHSIHYWSVPA